MRRIALGTLLLAFAACVTPPLPQPVEDVPDAMPPAPDAADNCEPRVANVGDGHHNPGTNCLECHNGQDPAAPIYSLAGTVYKDAAGTVPKGHATVVIFDGDGTIVRLPTATNGNFYTQAALTPPYSTAVTECPNTVPMITNFVDGDCNSCHVAGKEPGLIQFNF